MSTYKVELLQKSYQIFEELEKSIDFKILIN